MLVQCEEEQHVHQVVNGATHYFKFGFEGRKYWVLGFWILAVQMLLAAWSEVEGDVGEAASHLGEDGAERAGEDIEAEGKEEVAARLQLEDALVS